MKNTPAALGWLSSNAQDRLCFPARPHPDIFNGNPAFTGPFFFFLGPTHKENRRLHCVINDNVPFLKRPSVVQIGRDDVTLGDTVLLRQELLKEGPEMGLARHTMLRLHWVIPGLLDGSIVLLQQLRPLGVQRSEADVFRLRHSCPCQKNTGFIMNSGFNQYLPSVDGRQESGKLSTPSALINLARFHLPGCCFPSSYAMIELARIPVSGPRGLR